MSEKLVADLPVAEYNRKYYQANRNTRIIAEGQKLKGVSTLGKNNSLQTEIQTLKKRLEELEKQVKK
jgi:predicted  nucleic acid-binding Zn-ribbon protein